MTTTNLLLLACLAAALFLCARTSISLRFLPNDVANKNLCNKPQLLSLIAILPILAMCAFHIPLPAFFILLYFTNCFPPLICKNFQTRAWLIVNTRFLLFATPYLMVLGLLALFTGLDVYSVLTSSSLRIFSLVVIVVLDAVSGPVLTHYLGSGYLRYFAWDSEEVRLFSWFMCFCVCSVLLDSVPCLFPLPKKFPFLFLIGSNVLLVFMVILFARHIYSISREAYLKDEFLRLQEESITQRCRMAQLEHEAYLDPLTDIYTRQYALTNMANMLKDGESFSLAFLDLDGLKQVNDQQGHAAGDAYLQKFAALIKGGLRPNDIFARYGGDEFLILFPELALADGHSLLAAMQQDASAHWGTPFSFGLAQADPSAGLNAEDWVAKADHAMYLDKKSRQAYREGDLL